MSIAIRTIRIPIRATFLSKARRLAKVLGQCPGQVPAQPEAGRYCGECEQPITEAEPLEAQIVEWLRGFQPDEKLRAVALASLRPAAKREGGGAARRGQRQVSKRERRGRSPQRTPD